MPDDIIMKVMMTDIRENMIYPISNIILDETHLQFPAGSRIMQLSDLHLQMSTALKLTM